MPDCSRSPVRGRVLVASLGTARYEEVIYAADGGRSHETRFAPVATAAIEGGCTQAVLLLTEAALRANGSALEAELAELGLAVSCSIIPEGRSEAEVWTIFTKVLEELHGPERSEIILDITHAFRHLPVVLFGSLAYLAAADAVAITRIRYGAYEARVGRVVPLLDLTPLLTLIDAHHAVRQFADTGDARRLGRLLADVNRQLWVTQTGDPSFSRVVNHLTRLSLALGAGLPIEAGLRARATAEALEAWSSSSEGRAPAIGDALIARLRGPVEAFAVGVSGDKASLPLTLEEMARELRIIRFYLDVGAYDRVLLLVREWIVNRCLLSLRAQAWLDRGTRVAVERALNGLVERATALRAGAGAPPRPASDSSSWLAQLWARVRDLRNRVAHPGMCPDEVWPSRDQVAPLVDECERHTSDDSWWLAHPPVEVAWVFVTPLGLSPGVLYSGLVKLQPPVALVVTSREGQGLLSEAAHRAGFDEKQLHSYVVQDAHDCFAEREGVEQWARFMLLETRRIVINVTGGTTGLQYLVEAVGRRGERLGLDVERVALIDRRVPEEQRRSPYVAAELVPLDRHVSRGDPTQPL
ncbi:MAG: TM1812 family CRISPR-associated protein [Armatimonadota bacterium]|nr:TM1812 family CRISPR-associated protein [Armatimonadota bacterium]